ncbi:MAG: hypothetical protein MUF00_19725, partial [Gemmatimonadaceae bacterium]|nr:hypothetical protein [Gemmatimonadaceae bacterium]
GHARATVDSPRVAQDRPHYDGVVSIDPAARTLIASWRITFVAPSRGDSVTLLVNPGLRVSDVHGDGIGAARVASDSEFTRITLPITTTVADTRTVALRLSGTPQFGTDRINGIDTTWVELGVDSFWFPVFAEFRQQVTARVALHTPTRWPVAASGTVRWVRDAAYIDQRVPQVDIAFVAAPGLRRVEGTGVATYVVSTPDSITRTVLGVASDCRSSLNAQFGARSAVPPTSFVLAPRPGPGYARGDYIVLSAEASTSRAYLTGFICHELAHFWSRRADSDGPENWLNEGFAEYVSGREVRRAVGDDAYASLANAWDARSRGQPPIWTPAATRRPNAMVAYRKAPFLLHRLEARVGRTTMDNILRRYMVDGVRTTPELLRAIREVAGAETERWFADELAR